MFLTVALTVLWRLFSVSSAANPCDTSSSSKFTQDKTSAPICIYFDGVLGDDGNDTTVKNMFYFSTKVDEYTLVGLVGSRLENETFWEDDVYVTVQAGGVSSKTKQIIENGNAVEQMGIVIITDEGKVDKLEWDTGCFGGCSPCINDFCATKFTECNNKENGCSLNLYVSWYGTDKNGDYLLSAGQRLSQFQDSSAEDYIRSVEKEAEDSASNANVLDDIDV